MKPKKREPKHHELPKYYLKGFCKPGTSFVWVYERDKPFLPGLIKGKNNPHRGGIGVTALRDGGYGEYEPKLQKKEVLADRVIKKIRNLEPIDGGEKDILAKYIGLMMRRVSYRDEMMRPRMKDTLAKSPMHALARNLANAGRFGEARELMDAMVRLQTDDGTTGLLRESMLRDFERVHAAIVKMPWRFLVAPPERYFVTTDDPVVFDRFQGLHNSPLLFPISSRVMLDGFRMHEKDLTYEHASISQTRHFNAMTMMINKNIGKIYSPQPDEWIQARWADGFVRGVDYDA